MYFLGCAAVSCCEVQVFLPHGQPQENATAFFSRKLSFFFRERPQNGESTRGDGSWRGLSTACCRRRRRRRIANWDFGQEQFVVARVALFTLWEEKAKSNKAMKQILILNDTLYLVCSDFQPKSDFQPEARLKSDGSFVVRTVTNQI